MTLPDMQISHVKWRVAIIIYVALLVAGGDGADDAPRVRRTKTPFFKTACFRTMPENSDFVSVSVRYGVKWWMQSLVEAVVVFFSQSISNDSSSADDTAIGVTPGGGLRFFALGSWFAGLTPLGVVGEAGESSALRLTPIFRFDTPLGVSTATGLVARLPARAGCPPRGLFPLLIFAAFGFGTLGLVARFATTEWPP